MAKEQVKPITMDQVKPEIGSIVWYVKRTPNRQGSYDYHPIPSIVVSYPETPNKSDVALSLQCFEGYGQISFKTPVMYTPSLKAEQSEGKWCPMGAR